MLTVDPFLALPAFELSSRGERRSSGATAPWRSSFNIAQGVTITSAISPYHYLETVFPANGKVDKCF